MEIEVKNLSLSYDKNILNNLSFKVSKNFICIIGPNGAGKTTLLKILSQNINMYSGLVLLNTKNLQEYTKNELSKIRAYVSSNEVRINNLSVFQYISFGRSPFQKWFGSLSKNDFQIMDKTLDLLSIEHLKNENINNISNGEMQRVQIARALVQEPKIIFLDEPISHLDISFQISIMKTLKELSLSDIMVIMVIHDINLATLFSDEIIILKSGKLISYGNTKDTINIDILKDTFNNEWEIQYNPFRIFPKI